MLQTLFYIPNQIAGVPVFGFGLVLAVFAVGSVALLAWLTWRQSFNADTLGYVPLLLLIGAAIYFLLPELCQERGLPIRGYGMMTVVAVVSGVGLLIWRGRRVGVDPEEMLTLAFWSVVPGILGARAFYVIEYWPSFRKATLGATLKEIANVAQGGLVVYGALIGGVVGVLAVIRLRKMPPLATLDLLAPSLMLGLAIGRLGCLLNGCCYGGVCDLHWKVTFPWASPVHFHQVRFGESFVHGLKMPSLPEEKFGGPAARPVITEVRSGSPADRQGLKPQEQITSINGQRTVTIDQAQWALMNAYKADILIKVGQKEYIHWIVEDTRLVDEPENRPPQDSLEIHGATIVDGKAGSPVIHKVARGSWAAHERLKPGQEVVSVNGRPVETIGELRRLLNLHATAPWLSVKTKGSKSVRTWKIRVPPPRSLPVHPTQPYSAINALLLCLLLLAYVPFGRRDGEVWTLFLTFYPITRFLLEIIRTDESPFLGTGLSISQNFSLVFLVCAAGLWVYILRKPPGTALPKYEPQTAKE